MTLPQALLLLLPVAFGLGWWLSRQWAARRPGTNVSELSSDYFRGLNYLLNEEQDKAIEVFLRLAEYNRDTVETHLGPGQPVPPAGRGGPGDPASSTPGFTPRAGRSDEDGGAA